MPTVQLAFISSARLYSVGWKHCWWPTQHLSVDKTGQNAWGIRQVSGRLAGWWVCFSCGYGRQRGVCGRIETAVRAARTRQPRGRWWPSAGLRWAGETATRAARAILVASVRADGGVSGRDPDEHRAIVLRRGGEWRQAHLRRAVAVVVNRREPLPRYDALPTPVVHALSPGRWHKQKFYTCADTFQRLGGVKMVCGWMLDWVQRSDWERHQEVEALAMTMSACWNFCSNDERSEHLLDSGVLDLLVSLLGERQDPLKRPPDRIRQKALGLLWSVIEYHSVQIKMVHHPSGVVDTLLDVCLARNAEARTLEMALGSLHICASNFQCVRALAPRAGKFHTAVAASVREWGSSVMVGYMACLVLASLWTGLRRQLWVWSCDCAMLGHSPSANGLPCAVCQAKHPDLWTVVHSAEMFYDGVGPLIEDWLAMTSPSDVRKKEAGHYVWRLMAPFTYLLKCPVAVVRKLGAFALANLCDGADNRDMLVEEEGTSVGPLQALCYSHDDGVRTQTQHAMQHIYQDSGVDPLRLSDICKAFISENFNRCFNVTAVRYIPKHLHHTIIPFDA